MENSSQLQDPDHPIVTSWLVFNAVGQGVLFILLITYAITRTLPQRNNPCLINLIFVSFLATIPPALLFYSGHQYTTFPTGLCLSQAVLMYSTLQMVFIAELCLVFDNWSELRSLCQHTRHASRTKIMMAILIAIPYITLGIWTIVAALAVVNDPAMTSNMTGPISYVYCRITGDAGKLLKFFVGIFLGAVSLIKLVLEIWVSWMIYAYPTRVQEDPTRWRTTIEFALRVIILTLLQLFVVLFNLINGSLVHNADAKRVYELMQASAPLVTFLIFGTEKTILVTWRDWTIRTWNFITLKSCRKGVEDPNALQPYNLPTWDPRNYHFDYIPSQTNTLSSDFSFEEKGLKTSYMTF